MSIYLICVEFGPPAPPPEPRRPLTLIPLMVQPRGPRSEARPAYALTDGIASSRLRLQGDTRAARDGSAMREAAVELISSRLAMGKQVAIVFVLVEGLLDRVITNMDEAGEVKVGELSKRFSTLANDQPVWVVA